MPALVDANGYVLYSIESGGELRGKRYSKLIETPFEIGGTEPIL